LGEVNVGGYKRADIVKEGIAETVSEYALLMHGVMEKN
jgi:hypothetical protein